MTSTRKSAQKGTRSKGPAQEVQPQAAQKKQPKKRKPVYADDEDPTPTRKKPAAGAPPSADGVAVSQATPAEKDPTIAAEESEEEQEEHDAEEQPEEHDAEEQPEEARTTGTPVAEIQLPAGLVPVTTKVSDATQLTEMQEEYLLQEPDLRKTLAEQLKLYVARNVFPGAKFPLSKERELQHCRVAAAKGDVELPEGVSYKGFAKSFRKEVRDKMKTLRANAHASARYKFERDFGRCKVPDNFEHDLLEHYRDYLDGHGKVIPARKKHLNAFIYFIDRILPSVNYDMNDYGPVAKKNKLLQDCFTASDEAYALIMIQNYTQRWIRQIQARDAENLARKAGTFTLTPKEGEERQAYQQPPEWFHARWTGSHDGNKSSGWDIDGIQAFTKHGESIKEMRRNKIQGEKLEKYIVEYWKGTIKTKSKRKPPKVVFEAFAEDHIDPKYAEV